MRRRRLFIVSFAFVSIIYRRGDKKGPRSQFSNKFFPLTTFQYSFIYRSLEIKSKLFRLLLELLVLCLWLTLICLVEINQQITVRPVAGAHQGRLRPAAATPRRPGDQRVSDRVRNSDNDIFIQTFASPTPIPYISRAGDRKMICHSSFLD